MKTLVLLVAILVTTLGLAGCASDGANTKDATTAAPTGDVPAGDATVDMIDVAFAPETLRVRTGSTVTWRNLEDMGHTVTADDAGQWGTAGSGDAPDQWMMKDDTWSWTFTAPGTYNYHCLPHATKAGSGYIGMAGTIIVE